MGCLELINENQQADVLNKIGYTEQSLLDDLTEFKLWARGQLHLPPSILSEPDCFFETFLVGCKGKMELCKEKLDNYYSIRAKLPHFFSKRDPTHLDFQRTLEYMDVATLPKVTPDGCRVSILAFTDPDHNKFNFIHSVQRFLLIVEQRAREEGIWGGEWIILDAYNVTIRHCFRITPKSLKEVLDFIQKVLPSRIKGVIIINGPPFLEKTINFLVKPFLKKKLCKRIFVHVDGGEILLKYFPVEILPKEYGGYDKSLKTYSSKRYIPTRI